MSSKDLDEVWFWGSATRDYVEKILLREEEGTFVVFIPNGKQEELNLAVRVLEGVIFKTIYCRDGLYGYTEPLSFEDLSSALDAYNNSIVDSGQLINTLRRPEDAPVQAQEEDDILQEFSSITDLLHYLRKTSSEIKDKVDEHDRLKLEMKRIDKEIEKKLTTVGGLRKMTGIMEQQKQVLAATRLRSSTNPSRSTEFTRHEEMIEAHLRELVKQVKDVENDVETYRGEYSQVSKEHSRCITEISRSESIQEKYKMRLEEQPQFLEFVDGLLMNDLENDQLQLDKVTWFKDCSSREAEKLLLDDNNLDGTFLVRPFKPKDNIPYCVCVLWTTKTDKRPYRNAEAQERKVEKFSVVTHEGYFGFDLSTCIFESLEELILAYSRIPFRVHDQKYGNLTLNYPAFMGQYQGNRNS